MRRLNATRSRCGISCSRPHHQPQKWGQCLSIRAKFGRFRVALVRNQPDLGRVRPVSDPFAQTRRQNFGDVDRALGRFEGTIGLRPGTLIEQRNAQEAPRLGHAVRDNSNGTLAGLSAHGLLGGTFARLSASECQHGPSTRPGRRPPTDGRTSSPRQEAKPAKGPIREPSPMRGPRLRTFAVAPTRISREAGDGHL